VAQGAAALDPRRDGTLLSGRPAPAPLPANPVNSLADTLWTLVRWAVPVTVAGVVAAGAIGTSRIGEEVRGRVEARLIDGVLTVTCPKAPQCQPRKVEVRTS